MANEFVTIMDKWWPDRHERYISSPNGWKLLYTEPINQYPFVVIRTEPLDSAEATITVEQVKDAD